MKGSSALGIDGFTVNWLQKFWDSLKLVTYNAIKCYGIGSLTIPLKNRHHSLAQEGAEGPDTHWNLQTNLAPLNPLQACLVLH